MSRIQILSDDIINQIAAGEVVERPASALKELVDNALDAGCEWIHVDLDRGGLDSIIVRDDGCGMGPEDARLSLKRHATSKIRSFDDLFSVRSMGFRGEALAAISSVSKMTLTTVPAGSELGTKIICHGDQGTLEELPWSGPSGTTVAVRSLFYNVPARAKFVKSPAVEFGYCLELIEALALCHTHVGFSVRHQGKEQFRVPPQSRLDLGQNARSGGDLAQKKFQDFDLSQQQSVSEDTPDGIIRNLKGEEALRARAKVVMGKEAAQLLYVTRKGRFGSLEALIAPPGITKSSGQNMFFFVNDRWVKDKVMRQALLRGYHSHLPVGRFPWAVLHLTVDPSVLDVNVHPAKTEIRFQYPQEMHQLITDSVRESLRQGSWSLPDNSRAAAPIEGAVRDASWPSVDLSALQPSWPHSKTPDQEEPSVTPKAQSHRDGEIFSGHSLQRPHSGASGRDAKGAGAGTAQGAAARASFATDSDMAARPSFRAPSQSSEGSSEAGLSGQPRQLPVKVTRQVFDTGLSGFQGNEQTEGIFPTSSIPEEHSFASVRGGLFEDDHATTRSVFSAETVPWDQLEYVGNFAKCYLIFRNHDALLFVDQHAFHERILYEKLVHDVDTRRESQALLVPEGVDLPPSDVEMLVAQHGVLSKLGFDYKKVGPGTIEILAVPPLLVGRDLAALFADLAGTQGASGLGSVEPKVSELGHELLAKVACHGAVRAGEDLMPGELRHLLAKAQEVDFYHNCPHGRRVFRWWKKSQVAQWFDR